MKWLRSKYYVIQEIIHRLWCLLHWLNPKNTVISSWASLLFSSKCQNVYLLGIIYLNDGPEIDKSYFHTHLLRNRFQEIKFNAICESSGIILMNETCVGIQVWDNNKQKKNMEKMEKCHGFKCKSRMNDSNWFKNQQQLLYGPNSAQWIQIA